MSQRKDYNNLRVDKQENILTNHPDTGIYINISCDSRKCLTDIEFVFKHGSGKISLLKMQNYVQEELIRKTLFCEEKKELRLKSQCISWYIRELLLTFFNYTIK